MIATDLRRGVEQVSDRGETVFGLTLPGSLLARSDPGMLREVDAVQYGYTRPATATYAAESWVVGYRGNGLCLTATQRPRLRFRVGAPVWTGPVAARVA